MLWHEEFDRCEQCGEGWFKIERRVLVTKGSTKNNPVHNKVQDVYVCANVGCDHVQYTKPVDE